MTPFIQHHNHDFFKAACQNVSSTKAAYKLIHNEINKLITKKPLNEGSLDSETLSKIKLLTKLAIPVYTAYSEAIFLKLIYTPCGVTKQEIDQIFTVQKRQSIIQAWKETLIISTRKSIGKKSNFLPNSRKKIEQIINRYLQEPSELRNKIAHGQWTCTFNKHNSALTHETSAKIEKITIVDIDIWLSAFTTLGELLFLANQSPLKGYSEQYWNKITKIEQELERRSSWTFNKKVQLMHAKHAKKDYYKALNASKS